jgi:hypothetical protein
MAPHPRCPFEPPIAETLEDPLQERLHSQWHIRCVLLLVAFLHIRYQVSYRACGLILVCLNFIFVRQPGGLEMPLTLKTVFSRLGMEEDRFTQHLLCYQCHRYFDRNTPSDALCPDCELELFHPATRQLFQRVISTVTGNPPPPSVRKPKLVAPVQLLSDGLRDFFRRPGMVPAVNLWKSRESTPGESRTIQDGRVWKTLKGHDKQSFFYGESSKREIRIGTTFSLDW